MKKQGKSGNTRLPAINGRLAVIGLLVALVLVMTSAWTAGAVPLDITYDYGWENGGTLLGAYGNLSAAANVASGMDPIGPTTVTPHGGSAMLQVTESPHSGTPQGYVAFIENLVEGDEVTASFWGWDSTPGASPSLRIWGHYAVSGDIENYQGSAGGNNTYTDGTGWSQLSYTWTFDDGADPPDPPARDAMVIEVRLYSTPSDGDYSTDYWIDDVQVIAPDAATVTFPAGTTAVRMASFGVSPEASGLSLGLVLAFGAVVCVGGAAVVIRKRR
jgi:hypothetical protein